MSFAGALLVSTSAMLAFPLAIPLLSATAAAESCPIFPHKYAAWTGTPQQAADGAQAQWVLRQKAAPDWAAWGFAAETIWAATDGQDLGTTTVEVGDTQGWEGSNIWTFYSASVVNVTTYYEARIWFTPTVGTSATFQVIPAAATGFYVGQATYQGSTKNVSWQNHHPGTTKYKVGTEFTCSTARVDRTYVYTNQFRRSSDKVYVNPNNGLFTSEDSPSFIGWCSQPVRFRDYVNNQIGDGCG